MRKATAAEEIHAVGCHVRCLSVCVPACFGTAVLGGLWLSRVVRKGVVGALVVAIATGGLGCACVGVVGLAVMALGLALTTSPALLAAARA